MSDRRLKKLCADLADSVQSGSAAMGAILRRYWEQSVEGSFAEVETEDISIALSAAMDDIVRCFADVICDGGIAILAIGGYGRGRLAPYSDIDLLILTPTEATTELLSPFLYGLWDAQMPLSQHTHTPESAVAAASDDVISRTAFLDARFIWGNMPVFEDFQRQFEQLRRRTITTYIDTKIEEQSNRHQRLGQRGFEIEPNIKDGRGGLRDLDTLHWINRYSTSVKSSPKVFVGTSRLLNAREERRLSRLVNFFWTVRVHLHRITGRADEQLYFGLQRTIAEKLGYSDRSGASAVERFMRHYFLSNKEVIRLTGTAVEMLRNAAVRAAEPMLPLESVIARVTQEYPFDDEFNLVRRNGRLTFMDHARATETPRDMFAIFRAAGKHEVDVDAEALKTVARGARRLTPEDHHNPEVSAIFSAILRQSNRLEAVLRSMADCGLLGRYLPGFGSTIGKIEYGLFRQFTLDEHVLQSVKVLNDILHDRDDGHFVLSKPMAKAFGDPAPLYLALLLQETRGGMSAPTPRDVRLRAEENALHVLCDARLADLVGYAVAHRDLLFRAASRRNVTDDRLIRALSENIPTQEHLAILAITSSCRHHTAGMGSWEEYTKRDVRVLIKSLQAFLSGGVDALAASSETRRITLRAEAKCLLDEVEHTGFDQFIVRTGPTFWSMADISNAAEFSRLVTRTDAAGDLGGAIVMRHPREGLQALVYTGDEPKIFARCAGVVTEAGASVASASAFPLAADSVSTVGRACLLLHVTASAHSGVSLDTSPEACEVLAKRFTDTAQGNRVDLHFPAPLLGDRRSVFEVTPVVRFHKEVSDVALVVEVEALDRVGLLFDLANALAELGVSIQLAFVGTYGHRAVDTFYLLNADDGTKICDPAKINRIESGLHAVLARE